eukprot:scaffold1484_cov173-Amphora_coffeaeformis.AAC.20
MSNFHVAVVVVGNSRRALLYQRPKGVQFDVRTNWTTYSPPAMLLWYSPTGILPVNYALTYN